MTWKRYAINLISQFIENLNAQSKTVIEIDKLLNKDWDHLEIIKEEKKTLPRRLVPYVKVGKTILKYCASCFNRIKQTWSIANSKRFLQLYYPKNSEMFFSFVTIVIMHIPTFSRCQKAISKLNKIIIAQLMINRRPNILSNT